MKNRIFIIISIILTLYLGNAFRTANPLTIIIPALAFISQIYILTTNKINWAVRIGNYGLPLSIIVAFVGGFNGITILTVVVLAIISCLSFMVGALIPKKSTTVSSTP